MKKWFFLIGFVSLYFFSPLLRAEPLPADEVFKISTTLVDPNSFFITWKIKPGYFLYADRIKVFAHKSSRAEIGLLQFPPTVIKKDSLGHTYAVYRNELVLPVPILGQQEGRSILNVDFQGCSDAGFCYPPEKYSVQLHIDGKLALTSVKLRSQHELITASQDNQQDQIGALFHTHYWPATLALFFGLGLLLAFTPCVLPMVPVLSGIIVGHGAISTRKAFGLSLSYVLSMATTYAFIGVSVALLGENLQMAFQSPLIISLFSGLFVILSLSMFGLFDLKFPTSWQAKLAQSTRRQSTGHYLGAAIMGCLSTLVLSPCVTAPLVGALGYIAQTGNVLFGGAALFALGLGMGAPLLLIGASAGKWLPKAGPWMNAVKSFFGVLLLAVAIMLLARILPAPLTMALWAVLLIFTGVYSGAFTYGTSHREKFKQSIGLAFFIYGLLLLIGASMGGENPLKPLEKFTLQNTQTTQGSNASDIIVTSGAELNNQLSKALGKPVLLDFYADWCTSCKVMEATTFLDKTLQKTLQQWVVIKVDITQNTADQRALLKKYHVIAPPTFIFIDAKGQEFTDSRLVGEISSQDFIKQLRGLE